MKRICDQCQTVMVGDCSINSAGFAVDPMSLHQISIKKKGKEPFDSVSAFIKAAVCPKCGNVVFYIEDSEDYVQFAGYGDDD